MVICASSYILCLHPKRMKSHLKLSAFSVSLIPQAVGRFSITSSHSMWWLKVPQKIIIAQNRICTWTSPLTKFLNEFGLCSPISCHIDPSCARSGGNFARTTTLPLCASICWKLCATAFLRDSANQESNNGVHHSHSHEIDTFVWYPMSSNTIYNLQWYTASDSSYSETSTNTGCKDQKWSKYIISHYPPVISPSSRPCNHSRQAQHQHHHLGISPKRSTAVWHAEGQDWAQPHSHQGHRLASLFTMRMTALWKYCWSCKGWWFESKRRQPQSCKQISSTCAGKEPGTCASWYIQYLMISNVSSGMRAQCQYCRSASIGPVQRIVITGIGDQHRALPQTKEINLYTG